MILQRLKIHNIASIEDAEIDFSAKPLSDADVFLIAGKTGAGKSTILDAICLALYGTTPRMHNTEMQGYVKDAENDVRINNPGQMLRRGTAEGSICLDFTGNNGCAYEASWSIARARRKPNGKLQNRVWSLLRDDWKSPLTKEADIKAEIRAAVGLDFTQFCRTTMLAQGDFSKFLNSKDADKASILEKITGMAIYARIGRKIHEITADRKNDLDRAKLAGEGILILSDDDIRVLQQQIADTDTEYGATEKTVRALQSKASWLNIDAELAKGMEAASKAFKDAEEKTLTDDFARKKELTQRWNRTEEARNLLAGVNRDEKELAEKRSFLSSLNARYLQFIAGLMYEAKRKEELSGQIKALDLAVGNGDLPGLREKHSLLTDKESALKILSKSVETLLLDRGKLAEKEARLAQSEESIREMNEKCASLTTEVDSARKREEEYRDLYEGEKNTVDEFARTMRAHLHQGDRCPVCLQPITLSFQSEEKLREIVERQRKEWKKAEGIRRDLEKKLNEAVAYGKALSTLKEKEEKEIAAEKSRLEKVATEVLPACRDHGLESVDETVVGRIDNMIKLLGEEKTELEKTLRNAELREKLVAASESLSSRLGTLEQSKLQMIRLMPEWEASKPDEASECASLSSLASELLTDLSGVTSAIKRLQEEILSSRKGLDLFFSQNPDITPEVLSDLSRWKPADVGRISRELEVLSHSLVEARASLNEVKKRRDEHNAIKPEFSEEETPEWLKTRVEELTHRMKELSERKGSIVQRLEEDSKHRLRLAEINREIEVRKREYDRWYRLDSLLGSREGDKFRKIAQSYVLKNLVLSANHYMASLSGRYRLVTSPNSFVISVEDAYQGGTVRAASTLSGGETFIVSLSLALALSDIGDRLGVNTLFIDEGFGSLSGEPLQNAITTLRSLHNKTGRHVGIISHVEELQEKIPVQIRVEQSGIGASSTIRITEAATLR